MTAPTTEPGSPRRTRSDGIRTVSDLRDRCVIDDITGCWHWRGATARGRSPVAWLPAIGSRTTMGVIISVLLTGAKPPKGRVWHHTCETPFCANPKHQKLGTRSSQMLVAAVSRGPLQRARIARGKRKASRVTDAQVEDIRADSGTLAEISSRAGVSVTYASKVRRGEIRRPLDEIAATSVFAWRHAA